MSGLVLKREELPIEFLSASVPRRGGSAVCCVGIPNEGVIEVYRNERPCRDPEIYEVHFIHLCGEKIDTKPNPGIVIPERIRMNVRFMGGEGRLSRNTVLFCPACGLRLKLVFPDGINFDQACDIVAEAGKKLCSS